MKRIINEDIGLKLCFIRQCLVQEQKCPKFELHIQERIMQVMCLLLIIYRLSVTCITLRSFALLKGLKIDMSQLVDFLLTIKVIIIQSTGTVRINN